MQKYNNSAICKYRWRKVINRQMFINCSAYGSFQLLGVFGKLEGFDAVLDVAVHEVGQVVHAPADAVVGDAALGIVVGAHLLAAVARGHHGLALRGELLHILVVLALIETCAKDADGLLLVLYLALLVLSA